MSWLWVVLLLMMVTFYIYAWVWEKVDYLRRKRDQGIGGSQLSDKAVLIAVAVVTAVLFKTIILGVLP